MSSRYAETLFGFSGFGGFSTTRVFLITAVHIVGIPSQTGGFRPVVNEAWVNSLFRAANNIWSQACIELVPYSASTLVTNFRDISLSAFARFCLTPDQFELVEPHDINNLVVVATNLASA